MKLITRVADKAGVLGSLGAAMGCASCFPALASLGAAVGLGFLAQWEGLFITFLIPLFAALALLANGVGWFSHRQWHRTALGVIGPLLVLSAAILIRFYGVPIAPLLYMGLAFMIAVSIWDVVAPAARRCGPDGCELPPKRG
ncbi:organomercurial transporter MerC [Paraburkholderia fungorum]|jgi:mercuric ion transport protein|uniref:Organomercurial transporter MerC n=1 Tax=Paraburkholderia fungorum TaxID=134537 RepID=A0AAP5Q553_9BURK|nr:organomercurial transporter MerC [Paraburkholderia fungorum]MDT8835832.1 organomercurial transporter MerC [Paraburkholderia fungorum]